MSGTQQLLLGEVSGGPATYIEDVFSTYLYTGTNAARSIVNGIDLAGKGGLVWIKSRASAYDHVLIDTARGRSSEMSSDLSYSAATFGSPAASGSDLTSFNTDGFSLGTNYKNTNASGDTLVSWSFRKQPKFFDCFTFVGDGTTNRKIAHSLGSVPGFMLVKSVTTNRTWNVYHRSLGNAQSMSLETTGAAASSTIWNSTTPTATEFTVQGEGNLSGNTYIVYLYAHDAGGFGLTGTDNVISCGSYTGNGSTTGPVVTLGYEPQWLMVKTTASGYGWYMVDNMRGFTMTTDEFLLANTADPGSGDNLFNPTATGFQVSNAYPDLNNSGTTYVYMAIRKGPMKVPTDATKVFAPVTTSATAGTVQTTTFPVDAQILRYPQNGYGNFFVDRLRGVSTTNANQASPYLLTNATDAETSGPSLTYGWNNTGFAVPGAFGGIQSVYYNFRRAPSFFDEVCYTGNGAGTYNINHNLGVTPEMLIIKDRSVGDRWSVYFPAFDTFMTLNAINGKQNGSPLPSAVTSTTFNVGNTTGYASVSGRENTSGATYVSYLFATCAGVSKVGSYTGTGTLTTINCGFTGGARFVLIKRTDSTSNWFVWDTARGMVAGTDPSLSLNTTTAESNANSVYTTTTGFQLLASPSADVNTNGGSYIYLAIA